MEKNIKDGSLVFIFTGIFLMIFPAFLDRWPTIFGIACVFLFIPRYIDRKEVRWERKLLISVLICGIDVVFILFFCDKSIWVYQLEIYLVACVACLFTVSLKNAIMKQKGSETK